MHKEIWLIEWPFRLDSNIFEDKKQHQTSVQLKLYLQIFQQCTEYIMAQKVYDRLAQELITLLK